MKLASTRGILLFYTDGYILCIGQLSAVFSLLSMYVNYLTNCGPFPVHGVRDGGRAGGRTPGETGRQDRSLAQTHKAHRRAETQGSPVSGVFGSGGVFRMEEVRVPWNVGVLACLSELSGASVEVSFDLFFTMTKLYSPYETR